MFKKRFISFLFTAKRISCIMHFNLQLNTKKLFLLKLALRKTRSFGISPFCATIWNTRTIPIIAIKVRKIYSVPL